MRQNKNADQIIILRTLNCLIKKHKEDEEKNKNMRDLLEIEPSFKTTLNG
jgi:hypothetical protein